MSNKPKVSVIIPAFNVELWIGECLGSILSQTRRDIEVIVVDDGSTDRTLEICREIAVKDARVKIIQSENQGPSHARNVAIDSASGDWLMFVDADDLVPEFALEVMLAIAAGADIVSGRFVMFGDAVPALTTGKRAWKVSGREAAADVLYRHEKYINASAWGKIFRRDFWGNRRFVKGIRYEDLDLVPRVIATAASVVLTDTPVYLYRQHATNFLSCMTPQRLDVLDVTERLACDFSADPLLGRATVDRRLSAAFNMLVLMTRSKYDDPQARAKCREIIKACRATTLRSPRSRLKNRLAALLSYLIIR